MSFRNKLLISVFSFILFFLIADFTLAKIFPKKCSVVRPDEFLYLVLVPNSICKDKNKEFDVTYSINKHGLRENQFQVEKENSVKRIMFLGDSFTYGTGVNLEDTFVKQFERKINENSQNYKIQTINAGVPAYGLLLEDLYLKSKGIGFEPNLVLVGLSMTDFFDERRFSKIAVYDDQGNVIQVLPPPQIKRYLPPKAHEFLANHSFSYNFFLKKQEDLWKFKERLVAKLKGREVPQYASQEPVFTIGDPDNDTFAITRDIDNELFDELFEPVTQRLILMKQFLDERDTPMILVIIPNGHQINSNQWVKGRKAMKLEDEKYPDKVFSELEDFAKNNGIILLNPLSQIREIAKNTQGELYFDFDGHLMPYGHQVLAGALFEFLTREELKLNIFE